MGKRPTIYSLAQELGLHASTVSRAFNQPDKVNAKSRERVLRRAAEVDYQPNLTARRLITGRAAIMGLIIPDIENPFFPPVIRAVQNAALLHELNVMLLDSELCPKRELQLITKMRRQMDGLILASPRSNVVEILEACGDTPTVLINQVFPGVRAVIIDNSAALEAAGDALANLGHRKIALLRGPASSWAARERAKAVRSWSQAEKHVGLELTELGPFDATFDGGFKAASHLIASGATAAIAFDDLMACGTVAGLADRGLAVPEDYSVVGCDDVLLARTSTPTLSTVTAPVDDICRTAVDLLRSAIAGEPPGEPIAYPGLFKLRASIGPALA